MAGERSPQVIADAIKLVEDSAADGDRPEINRELFFGGPVPTLVDLSKDAQMVVAGCRGRTGCIAACSGRSAPG